MLDKANATIKLRKMKLARNIVDFLGMSLSSAGWSMSKRFIQSMDNVKPAKNIEQLRGLIGVSTGNVNLNLIIMN